MPSRRHDPSARPSGTAPRRASWPLAALLAALLTAGCGGEAALVVPFFTFGFVFNGDVGGAQHDIAINLNPNAPTTESGNFEEFSNLRFDNNEHVVTGSYSGCTLKLNLAPIPPATTVPAPLAASYEGRFTGPDTIQLTPQGGDNLPTLTVVRGQGGKDTRAKTC
ncbi:hypothetical protein GCM10007320_02700 [Pseudorhodoferax aquiterrae]|uniref:Lipoprotein n=1 Tax=Pseudorhodoferax aquiterrae TaxID=747304 RepID=A0ABQ3FUP1_9BURK|nr:hypothetical protein [Pseudorhodoferax aquiterrae]GHC69348.1 hypothetical protein GCM10007320_02700 [Pseudorhodoferax aquiterrae]